MTASATMPPTPPTTTVAAGLGGGGGFRSPEEYLAHLRSLGATRALFLDPKYEQQSHRAEFRDLVASVADARSHVILKYQARDQKRPSLAQLQHRTVSLIRLNGSPS